MTISITSFLHRASATFTYLVDDGEGTCAVIDPVLGFDMASGRTDSRPIDELSAEIERRGLSLQWLLETHVHADHLSGAAVLQQRLGGTIAIGAAITQVQQLFRSVFHDNALPVDGSPFHKLFRDGDAFRIGRLSASVLHVPGHTPADIAFRIDDPDGGAPMVFVGDTLFMPDVGTARCDFPGGDAHTLYRSIQRLLAFPPETRLYVCHDYPPVDREHAACTTVGMQRANNVHIRDGVDEDTFVVMRNARDATLAMPALMLPSIQINMRAGGLPPPESNGTSYIKIPIDLL
jgi:glyoxylase-like metal-dependent hydrolase (beta-lactamase superfamily II)